MTSEETDPLLSDPPPHIRSFFVGTGAARMLALNYINAGVVAMTMPDLNSFHIKRSAAPVHYTYIHHSMVSSQMVYRTAAFDHFDSILCVGPHHVEEMRAWESLKGLPPKQLFEHGYGPLDHIRQLAKAAGSPQQREGGGLNILLAPSWGPAGIMETIASEVTQTLLEAGHYMHVRPHPRTRQITPRAIDDLKQKFASHPRFDLREDTTDFDALLASHIMISDWSGVAMEFAFGLERPVLFLDVPRKINNLEYGLLDLLPLEVAYREEVGRVLSPEQISDLPAAITELHNHSVATASRIAAVRDRSIFNVGSSVARGAEIIASLTDHHSDN
ncbi:MAG: CDP-glycerol--glycerophosphate glycerophosphotransferase [Rhodospirillales bacterium]|nr:CDP-glycerol--glycerophosphate glycerophosphotransferase [Rhodospirillales bacterium]